MPSSSVRSPQKNSGIEGIGSVTTSSPTSSISECPCSSHDSTAHPSARHCSSPSYTGSSGQPPTNAVHTSVPPLVENSHTSAPTWRCTQRKLSGASGEPVEPIARRDRKSTRLNSSHLVISYAVFCLKKKK